MTRLAVLLTMCAIGTGSAQTGDWSCRNEAAEVTCGNDACTVSTDHTPMDLRVGETGALSICAYTGCWEGRASRLSVSEAYLMAEASDLRWSSDPEATGIAGLVAIDRRAGTGTVMVAGFVNPLTCRQAGGD